MAICNSTGKLIWPEGFEYNQLKTFVFLFLFVVNLLLLFLGGGWWGEKDFSVKLLKISSFEVMRDFLFFPVGV